MQELKEYRRAGIRTFADAEVYEADKKRKSTVQPSLTTHPPGSLPKNWQYGFPSADSSLQVFPLLNSWRSKIPTCTYSPCLPRPVLLSTRPFEGFWVQKPSPDNELCFLCMFTQQAVRSPKLLCNRACLFIMSIEFPLMHSLSDISNSWCDESSSS